MVGTWDGEDYCLSNPIVRLPNVLRARCRRIVPDYSVSPSLPFARVSIGQLAGRRGLNGHLSEGNPPRYACQAATEAIHQTLQQGASGGPTGVSDFLSRICGICVSWGPMTAPRKMNSERYRTAVGPTVSRIRRLHCSFVNGLVMDTSAKPMVANHGSIALSSS